MKKLLSCLLIFFVVIITATTLNAQHQWNYVSPVPGSKFINPENNIAVRHGEVIDQNSLSDINFSVQGSLSGTIEGKAKLSNDKRTLIFLPETPFRYDEKISVKINSGIRTVTGKSIEETAFGFQTAKSDNLHLIKAFYQQQHAEETGPDPAPSSGSYILPDQRGTDDYPEGFPIPEIYEFNNPAPGYIFSGSRPFRTDKYDPYLMILDNYGTPVFYRNWPRRTNDFKLTANNQLTFCDFNNSNPEINKYLVMDSHFNITDTLVMGNGYIVDQHDMLMRENGNHFLMAYDPQLVNMDTVVPGGDTAATVVGFVIQELDADGNVIFQWRSWDHFEITDANHTDFTDSHIDYVHGNAFEIDYDGNLLMSLRNMEEVTKISLETGEIIWRLGLHAKNNMFTFTNDTIGFSWQHDVRRIDNGNITVYDNGNYHSPPFSQALEYEIDEVNYTVTRVWNYIHDPVIFARATGAHRRLNNGNSFICWGLTWPISISEASPEGDLAWELHWPDSVWEYRSFKFEWESDYFEINFDTIDFGEYDDYVPWPKVITVTNNTDEDIEISSSHNHWDSYYVSTTLPLTVPANGSANLTLNFFPNMQGQINDVLTLRYESMYMDTLPQAICKQVYLKGFVEDANAPSATLTPSDGSVDVPQDTEISIAFDEPVKHTGGAVIKNSDIPALIEFKKDGSTGEEVSYTAAFDVWKQIITIKPDTLYPLTDYYLKVKADMFADGEGNVMSSSKEATFTTVEESGVEENMASHIQLFPNPTTGLISLQSEKYRINQMNVLDINGKTVFTKTAENENRLDLDLSDQPAGIYFIEVHVEDADATVSFKIVKQ